MPPTGRDPLGVAGSLLPPLRLQRPDGGDSWELAERAMRKEGQDPSDREQRNRTVKRVTQCLWGLRIKGEASSGYNEQGYFVWELAR